MKGGAWWRSYFFSFGVENLSWYDRGRLAAYAVKEDESLLNHTGFEGKDPSNEQQQEFQRGFNAVLNHTAKRVNALKDIYAERFTNSTEKANSAGV